MCLPPSLSIHQLRVVLQGVSPLVWRRLLGPCDISLADLHQVLQTALGWSDFSLYESRFHGRTVGRDTGDPHAVRLADLALHGVNPTLTVVANSILYLLKPV